MGCDKHPPHADTTSSLCPMGLRGQMEQTPTSRSGIGSDTICNDPAQPCRYCPLRAQGALTTLKRVYKVERSPYLYSARKFLPYPMWDVTYHKGKKKTEERKIYIVHCTAALNSSFTFLIYFQMVLRTNENRGRL